jgi:hypothetical protein
VFITFDENEDVANNSDRAHIYSSGKEGYKVVKTREPGGTPFGESLRNAFLHTGTKVDPLSECSFSWP